MIESRRLRNDSFAAQNEFHIPSIATNRPMHDRNRTSHSSGQVFDIDLALHKASQIELELAQ